MCHIVQILVVRSQSSLALQWCAQLFQMFIRLCQDASIFHHPTSRDRSLMDFVFLAVGVPARRVSSMCNSNAMPRSPAELRCGHSGNIPVCQPKSLPGVPHNFVQLTVSGNRHTTQRPCSCELFPATSSLLAPAPRSLSRAQEPGNTRPQRLLRTSPIPASTR